MIDAWREALAGALVEERAQWARERALIEAQAQAAVAELRAEIVTLRAECRALIEAHLATVRSGAAGERGERGLTGEPGPAGPAGERGERGEMGPPGEQGVQGDRGEAGREGEAGPPGPCGPDGIRGDTGVAGPAGPQGDRGEPGATGEPGPLGPAGERGMAGERGPAGDRGERGAAGDRGPEGPAGKLAIAAPWTDEVHYEGAVVTAGGGTYQALRATGRPPPCADWICLAAPGRDARTPTPRGTFDPEARYQALDIVALNGGSFIALRDAPGACPGEHWQLLTRQGARGIAGPKGERGERGPAGERGVAAPKQTGWKLDRATYTAIPVLADGSDGPPLELRALFKQFQDETE